MRVFLRKGLFIVLSLMAYGAMAWNSIGHKLIVQIAYDQLDTQTRKRLNDYNLAMDHTFASHSLILAAVWLDTLHGNEATKAMHYIDLPYACASPFFHKTKTTNAVQAIKQAHINLQHASTLNAYQKGFNLRVLLHVTGDVHQPLHAVNYCSQQHPFGDYGGNLFPLGYNAVAANLHTYWDRGGGYLKNKNYKVSSIKRWAKQIEKRWPCSKNDKEDPASWVQESYQIALHKAYSLTPNARPDKKYQQQVKQITEQRIALAGCRLAKLLQGI
jgi:hypothetical protein